MLTDTQARFDELITTLKDSSYRLTPQRLELLRLIAASEGHPSAAQLYKKTRRKFPTMSQATVYKTLLLLKDLHQVLELELGEDRHYDGNRPYPHPHLVCTQCQQIVDAELEMDPASIRKIERTSGYQVVRSQVTFYGLCPECLQSQ